MEHLSYRLQKIQSGPLSGTPELISNRVQNNGNKGAFISEINKHDSLASLWCNQEKQPSIAHFYETVNAKQYLILCVVFLRKP